MHMLPGGVPSPVESVQGRLPMEGVVSGLPLAQGYLGCWDHCAPLWRTGSFPEAVQVEMQGTPLQTRQGGTQNLTALAEVPSKLSHVWLNRKCM